MSQNSPQKTILVTGATGGIGKAIAQALLSPSTQLILTGSSEPKLQELLSSFKTNVTASQSNNSQPQAIKADLSNYSDILALHQTISKEYSKIDWIIHAAGFIADSEVTTTHEQYETLLHKTFSINTYSAMHLSELFKGSINQHGGIISISSTASLFGNEFFPLYASSKGALNSFGKSFARVLSKKDASSIILCPGPTNTPMRERMAHDSAKHQSPDIIANLVKSITDNTSDYKNGDVVIIKNSTHSLHERVIS